MKLEELRCILDAEGIPWHLLSDADAEEVFNSLSERNKFIVTELLKGKTWKEIVVPRADGKGMLKPTSVRDIVRRILQRKLGWRLRRLALKKEVSGNYCPLIAGRCRADCILLEDERCQLIRLVDYFIKTKEVEYAVGHASASRDSLPRGLRG